jgi:membrane protease YdiL (CAAX protease family)
VRAGRVKLAGAGLHSLAASAAPEMPNLGEWAAVPLRFVFILLLWGPLGEEVGWRGGYARPDRTPVDL